MSSFSHSRIWLIDRADLRPHQGSSLYYDHEVILITACYDCCVCLLNHRGGTCEWAPRGTQLFQVGVCGPDFRSVGLANCYLPLKRGACELKFPNLGAWELKFGRKLRLLRLKISKFLKRGSYELTLLLEMGPLRTAGEAWKGGLQGRTCPYLLSRSVSPPPNGQACLVGWLEFII